MTPHLRNHVRAYVDRALPPAVLHLFDQHLVCCGVCRDAVDRERRIIASLRADTDVPTGLRSSLLGLASAAQAGSPWPAPQAPVDAPAPPARRRGAFAWSPDPATPDGPPVPVAPGGPGGQGLARRPHEPVPTVHPSAPALHRSPMRAAVVASIAAGASVAAAWGLAVSPVSGSSRLPSSRLPVASFGGAAGLGGPAGTSSLSSERSTSGQGSRLSAAGFGAVTVPYWVVTTRTLDRQPQADRVRFSGSRAAQSAP